MRDVQMTPLITIVTPVFNEEASLFEYERRISAVLLGNPDFRFEILFIDDGSSDRSWLIIKEIVARDFRFRGVRLSRNQGSHIAISAGVREAKGDAIAILACDLQDPPEVVLDFIARWRLGPARIIWGRRRTRQDPKWRKLASRVFFLLVARYAMPPGSKFTTGSFLLMDRRVADCYLEFTEHNRITFALVAWTGFEQEVVDYDRKARERGVSKWSFAKMMRTMYDAFIGFSFTPIRAMTVVGVVTSVLAFILLGYIILAWLWGGVVPGWTGQMLALSLFFGLQFLLTGVMGEYLYRIYAESVRRPLYFVSEKTMSDDSPLAEEVDGAGG
jgi:dolichol-phosphate mannosyltransferase